MISKNFSEEQIYFLIKNYPKKGAEWCAKFLPFNIKKIKNKAHRLKLKLNKNIRNKIYKNREISDYKRNVPVDQFINVNTFEAAYILGLLWAECWMYKKSYSISITLIVDDFYYIKNIFDKTGKWHFVKRERKNKKPSLTASMNAKKLFLYLQSNGYVTKRIGSFNKILSTIPDNLKQFWWLGFFDGDGCFYHNRKNGLGQMTIAGPHNANWNCIKKLFNDLNIKKYKINNYKNSSVRITNKTDIEKFGNYLYRSGNIILRRKYDKFLKIIKENSIIKESIIEDCVNNFGYYELKLIAKCFNWNVKDVVKFLNSSRHTIKKYLYSDEYQNRLKLLILLFNKIVSSFNGNIIDAKIWLNEEKIFKKQTAKEIILNLKFEIAKGIILNKINKGKIIEKNNMV